MKKILLLLLTAFITSAATEAVASSPTPQKAPEGYTLLDYKAPDWNDYPDMKVYGNGNISGTTEIHLNSSTKFEDNTLLFEVTTTEQAEFFFNIYSLKGGLPLKVFCDGELVSEYRNPGRLNSDIFRHIPIEPGKHEIQLSFTAKEDAVIKKIGVINTPLITANLYEPGSLGTEILANNVERLQDVRNLKVIGEMNSTDWEKIIMMKQNLVFVDLSEAITKAVPDNAFSDWDGVFLVQVLLPEGLQTIGKSAFRETNITEIDIPSTVTTIGDHAFYESALRRAYMGDATTNLGSSVFMDCYDLKDIRLSKDLKTIPSSIFFHCYSLENFEVPANLNYIGAGAFEYCRNINFDIPSSVYEIGAEAFKGTNSNPDNAKVTFVWPESYIGRQDHNIIDNTLYNTIIFPVGFSKADIHYSGVAGYILLGNTNITKIRFNSPTVVSGTLNRFIPDSYRANITLEVPKYLVNSYKLDSYWYNFKEIVGFDTDEIDNWFIRADLTLSPRDRMLGTPSIRIGETGSLKINGTDGMPLNNLQVDINPGAGSYGQIFSNADGVTVAGDLYNDIYFNKAQNWYYLSLPFDVKVGDIHALGEGQMAIRYYNGWNRATNGPSGSWQNLAATDIIHAGTGFIVNVSKVGSWRFPAQSNDNKQNITANQMFEIALNENNSSTPSNKGWNLVGNPYQCYYNIHKINFSAPITVRDGSKYTAYSIIDDDYALRPNEAFFVQRPDGINSLSFPLGGRQMTAEILSQQGAPAHHRATADRLITDILLSDGTDTDRTRVVLNDKASAEYQLESDASKWLGDAGTAQIYTIGTDGELYAINERPLLHGTVDLGFVANDCGRFTISLGRNDLEHVYLTDNFTGVVTDLAVTDYEFTADEGTYDGRFVLSFEGATSALTGMGIEGVKVCATDRGLRLSGTAQRVEVYSVSGMLVATQRVDGESTLEVAKGAYIVKCGDRATKVVVR